MPELRNWADLPREIANVISKKLHADFIYFLSFRAVCRNWRSSAPLSDLLMQLPWLIECDNFRRDSHLQRDLRFYSIAGGDAGTVRVPELYHGMVYYGPGCGYLFVSSLKNDLFLLNPLSGDAISLPYLGYRDPIRSPVCSGSSLVHNWHVVKFDLHIWRAAIYRPDENKWRFVEIDFCRESCSTCCWDEKLFVTEGGCGTGVFDIISGEKLYEAPRLKLEYRAYTTYLVESCGDILRIFWYFVPQETEDLEVPMFDIHKLCSAGEQHSWVEVTDIGDQIVFLDLMNGFSMRAPDGFEGNCIYFLLDDNTPCRYEISTRAVEMLSCPFKFCTWFIPHLG